MKNLLRSSLAKGVVAVLLAYVLLVVLFESSLGFFQPENASTLQISTTDAGGNINTRVLARIESGGQLFVAANHWPRAWYREALVNPAVHIMSDSEEGNYVAVPIEGAAHDAVNAENSLGLLFRILTGFPPRYFLRLDPVD
ncbi:MAG: hypothetical protein DHS20C12_22540 [Pseudohongiella sp.]|nr:MAG: hypothetical protein DHS20C12_22540 [Pseudohongiella sp.]